MKGLYLRGRFWHFRYSINGHQRRMALGVTDEGEALKLAKEIVRTPAKLEAKLWEDEVDRYLEEQREARRLSVNAAESRRVVLLRFAREAGVLSPQKVTTQIVQAWYEKTSARIADVTAQTYARWVATLMAHLARKGRVPMPLRKLEYHRLRKAPRKPFCTRAQVTQLIENAHNDELRFILYCGFHAGLRRDEISEARPGWFDLEEGLLHVQRSESWEPKDRDDRTIPLTQEFWDFLKKYGKRSPFMLQPKVRKGKSRYRYDFRRPFNEYVAAQKLPWVTPHTMRRTFASLKVSAGVSLYKVAIWLGDLERVVQDHYGFLIPKDSDIDRGL